MNLVAFFIAAAMPVWLKWGFWISPPTYGEISLYLNEFLAPRLQKVSLSQLSMLIPQTKSFGYQENRTKIHHLRLGGSNK